MIEKNPEKKLLNCIFKHKDNNEPTTAHDIEKVVIEQNQSAKQIKHWPTKYRIVNTKQLLELMT